MTLMTGTSTDSRSRSRPAAAAVLHATTTILTSCSSTSLAVICRAKVADLVERPRAVGIAAGVADVDEVLLREQVDDRPGHGQTAESAVEHADRPVMSSAMPSALNSQAARRQSGDAAELRPPSSAPAPGPPLQK